MREDSFSKVPPCVTLLRVYLADGSVAAFAPPEQSNIQQICKGADLPRLFTQQRLVIGSTHSKSVFVCSEIVRVDFVQSSHGFWEFPGGYSDVVELSEAEFRKHAHLDEPALMPRREEHTPVGDLLVSFLKLHFKGLAPVFAMIEAPVQLPAENQSFMRFLLSKTTFHARLPSGGVAVLNLTHLAGYTVYPGVAQIPSDSWLAEPVTRPPVEPPV
jgi:hypothetical protein